MCAGGVGWGGGEMSEQLPTSLCPEEVHIFFTSGEFRGIAYPMVLGEVLVKTGE